MGRIEGERLYLRNVELADAKSSYAEWMNDPEVVRYTESRFQKHTIESLRGYISGMQRPDVVFFAIVLKDGDRHIGNIKLGPINRFHQTADVGIIIGDKPSWGSGYGAEAIKLAVGYAFDTLKLHKLTAGCYAVNKRAIEAFKKAGFKIEGVKRQQWRLDDGNWTDGVCLGYLPEDGISRGYPHYMEEETCAIAPNA